VHRALRGLLGPEPSSALPGEGTLIRTGRLRVHREMTKGSRRLPFVASAALLAMVAASAGCADVSGQALQQDVAQLRQDVNSLTLAVHRGRGDTDTVVGQLDRRTREQGADTAKQIAAGYVDEAAPVTVRIIVDPLVTWMWIGGLIALSGALVALWPARRARRAPAPDAELEALKEAKYREIRDAELDHAAGKLSDEDYALLDAELRGEAIEILDGPSR